MLTWNIDPVLLELGPLQVRYYGIFFALSLFLAYMVARHMVKMKKLSLENLDSLAIYLIIGLVVGARLGHVLFYESNYYFENPEQIIQIWNGGLSSHGAAIGLLISYGLFLLTHKKVKFFDFADIIIIAASLPIGMVRLGNFFNSEIVGRPTDLPWSVVFERVDLIARHPSQIYEFLIGALLFAVFYPLWLKKNKKAKPGYFFSLYLMAYFLLRFLVEFVKDYPLHENFFNLTTGQILSIPFFLFGLIIYFWPTKK
ncbi:prolipoprotein diacylglyceryl transferase [Patescibacteria group bacterium]|nr:prolipoprotein diacylglyceryl transferase [Patescibacteria group bacterium]